jgi:hypothetical protein
LQPHLKLSILNKRLSVSDGHSQAAVAQGNGSVQQADRNHAPHLGLRHISPSQEYKEATKQKAVDTGITLIPNEQNLFAWRALLKVGRDVSSGCKIRDLSNWLMVHPAAMP